MDIKIKKIRVLAIDKVFEAIISKREKYILKFTKKTEQDRYEETEKLAKWMWEHQGEKDKDKRKMTGREFISALGITNEKRYIKRVYYHWHEYSNKKRIRKSNLFTLEHVIGKKSEPVEDVNLRLDFAQAFFKKEIEGKVSERAYYWLGDYKKIEVEFIESESTEKYSKYLQSLKENFSKEYPVPIPMSYYIPIDHLPIELYNRVPEKKENGKLFAMLQNKNRLVITEKAGYGKSYSLQQIVTDCLKKQSVIKAIPVYVTLSGLCNGGLNARINLSIQKFDMALSIRDFKNQENKVIFLLDGLDEVNSSEREQVKTDIEKFISDSPQSKFVVTSRPLGYETTLFQQDTFGISEKTSDQVISTIKTFFKTDKDKRNKILFYLDKNPRFMEIATNPYYLTIICNTLKLTLQVSDNIPNNVGDIYKNFLRIIENKEVERKGNKVEFWLVCEFLIQVAYCWHKENATSLEVKIFIDAIREVKKKFKTEASYLNQLKTTDIIHEIVKSGFLCRINKMEYKFAHPSWRDFFAAKYLVDKGDFNLLQEVIDKHLTEDKWYEVFLFVTGLLPKVDSFLLAMKTKVDSLVKNDQKVYSLLHWAQGKANLIETSYRPEAVRALYLNLALVIRDSFNFYYLSDDKFYDENCYTESLFNRGFTRDFVSTLDYTLSYDIESRCISSYDLNFDYAATDFFIRTLDSTDNFEMDANYFFYDVPQLVKSSKVIFDDAFLKHTHTHKMGETPLAQALQKLKYKNSTMVHSNKNLLAWTKEFQQVMIKYRNIGHKFDLKKSEMDLLCSYFIANSLLVECLQSECSVSKDTREKILNELLTVQKQKAKS